MKFLLDHDVPEDSRYLLQQLGHETMLVREALAENASDEAVLQFAHDHGCLLVTCNRNDFLRLAAGKAHHGIVILIRRRTRAAERAAFISPPGEGGRFRSREQYQLRLTAIYFFDPSIG